MPGTRPDRFSRAFASGADTVVIDFEDSVEAARKVEARAVTAEWLSDAPSSHAARFVRINAPGSPWIDEDLAWLPSMRGHVDGLVLPKAESMAAVEQVARAFRGGPVLPLLETVRGITSAVDVLTARDFATKAQIQAVLFGAEDLTAELGIPRTLEGEELLYARSRVVLAAALAGAEPIDAVWTDLSSVESLKKDALRARALGFRGKMAIHPDQVPVINEVFSPTSAEIAAAERLVEADEQARIQGNGVFRFDDRMVDAPVIKRARRVLAVAEALGKRGRA